MPVFCGIDWAEDHYDVAVVDDAGIVLARRRIPDDSLGYQVLLGLLAEHGDRQDDPIPVAIETPRGLLVACLRRTGRQIYAINPLSVARYRERHTVARAKSDRVDAELQTSCVRIGRRTGPCRLTPNSLRRSAYSRVRSRTPSGIGSTSPTNCGRRCVSTTQRSSKPFRIEGQMGWRIQMRVPFWCWLQRPPRQLV